MARHIIVCRSTFSAPSADAYTIISTNIAIARWRDHALRGKTVRDRGYQAADHRDERSGDMQPFRASHFFTAHEVRPDVENRERDRDKHSCGCERREPTQDSNAQGLLHLM